MDDHRTPPLFHHSSPTRRSSDRERHRHFAFARKEPGGLGARRFSVAPGDVARRIPIINIDRLHQHIARRRCHDRQQRWFERQERRAITGGAFGENGDGLMSGKCLPQFFYLKVYMAAGLPRDKDSMVLRRQPGDDRPACYAVMGNKTTAYSPTPSQNKK